MTCKIHVFCTIKLNVPNIKKCILNTKYVVSLSYHNLRKTVLKKIIFLTDNKKTILIFKNKT